MPAGQAVAVVALFAALGLGAGWLWFRIWDAPPGVVSDHTWYPDPYMPGQAAEFDAVAIYVLVALAAGVLGGVVCAFLLARAEVVTVAAVAVGSALAAWLMALVGSALGPADPDVLAKTAEDGTKLSGDLVLTGVSPYVALPLGALGAVLVVFLATPGHRPAEPRLAPPPPG
ncbi:hypothetical protein [Nocardioides lianchengensis]|uniref:hypothetical protein n=1 Tax=Nocardioides lianchengensis TaxID=1045774 RepID=UPI0011145B55|nr:hypothetical protein [Nocardioides lianchengensis]NYG10479.1 hypothetical protein [Nocardioides lianchengensis]